jgi:cytochrome P450
MVGSPPPADERKTEALARASIGGGGRTAYLRTYAAARTLLRDSSVVQAGAAANAIDDVCVEDVSLFYLDGAAHRQRRAAIAPFFTLRTIESRYRPIMERAAEHLIGRFAETGRGLLDRMAFRFAVAVAAEVIGLDHRDLEGLATRLEGVIAGDDPRKPVKNLDDEAVRLFNARDIQPAIDARRAAPREDVISRLIGHGCSDRSIRTEVRGYALAGMITTREFIVMAAWYLLERPTLFARFRDGNNQEQFAILDEILRLEPVVGFLVRQAPDGTRTAIDVRAANTDKVLAGKCPHALDTGRAAGSGLSFGDGPHRCPGAQLALHEARIFLAKLVAVPGIRLERAPRIGWFRPITSYELHSAMIACG